MPIINSWLFSLVLLTKRENEVLNLAQTYDDPKVQTPSLTTFLCFHHTFPILPFFISCLDWLFGLFFSSWHLLLPPYMHFHQYKKKHFMLLVLISLLQKKTTWEKQGEKIAGCYSDIQLCLVVITLIRNKQMGQWSETEDSYWNETNDGRRAKSSEIPFVCVNKVLQLYKADYKLFTIEDCWLFRYSFSVSCT